MTAMRFVVFPALRLLVWGAIAVSLGWLAFGRGDPTPQAAADVPTAEVVAPEVAVTRGTVENIVELTGTVSADAAVPVRSTAPGTVTRLWARVGDAVQVGTPLLDVVTETVPDVPAVAQADSAHPVPAAQPPPKRTTTVVRAASVGTLATLDMLVDQQVAVGDVVAAVSPDTLTVTAPLSQEQQFRLLALPAVADVTVPGGPAPFVCTDVRIAPPPAGGTTPDTGSSGDPSADPAASVTGAIATCRVPPGAIVFPGMSAAVSLRAGTATGVLVLPVTAVEGATASGTVYLPAPGGGEPQPRSVELGLTDGELVEVRSGLLDGDTVLEFVPSSDEVVDPAAEPVQ